MPIKELIIPSSGGYAEIHIVGFGRFTKTFTDDEVNYVENGSDKQVGYELKNQWIKALWNKYTSIIEINGEENNTEKEHNYDLNIFDPNYPNNDNIITIKQL